MRWKEDLSYDIHSYSPNDDVDGWLVPHLFGYDGSVEFTDCNREYLIEHFSRIANNCRAVLEIGVCRNSQQSSTYCFLNNKKNETVYVGIDIADKSFLNDQNKNIHTIQNSSSDIDNNMKLINSLGVSEFDFIFIDGWHSINQVLIDWEYTRFLSKNGIVGFHDISCHPGPNAFIKALNKDKWVVEEFCPYDWGIGFAWRKQ